MESKTLNNIDIEKNKELFEYEMTEVILALKGEFAVVSGKGTKYEELAVDDSKLKVSPIAVTEVELQKSEVTAPDVAKPSLDKIKEVELKRTVIDTRGTDKISLKKLDETTIEKIQVKVPEARYSKVSVKPAKAPEAPAAKATSADTAKISIPGKINTVTVKKHKIPAADIAGINIPAKISTVDVKKHKISPAADISEISIPGKINAADVKKYSISQAASDADKSIRPFTIKAADIKTAVKTAVPDIAEPAASYTDVTVSIKTPTVKPAAPVSVPDADILNKTEINASEARSVDVPEMKSVELKDSFTIKKEKIIANAPEIKNAAFPFNLNKAEAISYDDIPVPEKPDVSKDIDNIIRLACKQ